jgi:hypothetical protein
MIAEKVFADSESTNTINLNPFEQAHAAENLKSTLLPENLTIISSASKESTL